MILEDKSADMQWDVYVGPLGRTPMDKASAASMRQYFNKLRDFALSIAPGQQKGEDKWDRILKRAKRIEAELRSGK